MIGVGAGRRASVRYWIGVAIRCRSDLHPTARRRHTRHGLQGNAVLDGLCREAADDLCVRRAEANEEKLRAFATLEYRARNWDRPRKVVARMEATPRRGSTSVMRSPRCPEQAAFFSAAAALMQAVT